MRTLISKAERRDALGSVGADPERIAQAFLDLQDERHRADHDDTYDITRADAIGWVDVARDAVDRSFRSGEGRDVGYQRFLALGLGAVRIARSRG